MTRAATSRTLVARLAWALALMIPGALVFQPVFGGGPVGAFPALAGVVVGVLVAGVSAWRRWSLLPTVLLLLGAHFLLGGAVALRPTTIAGVVPTLETITSLAAMVVQSWRDLLTVATPAGDFTGPMVVPWFAGLVLSCVAATVMTRTTKPVLGIVVAAAWLVLGIAFGVRDTPAAVFIGVLLGVISMAWLVTAQLTATRDANVEFLANPRSQRGPLLRRAAMAGVVVMLAGGASYAAVAATSDRVDRHVLRDYVAPPLNIADYPTPLAKFRLYETDLKDEVLMTVTGLPSGERIRVASMDTYDGTVYNVSRVSADYVRVGRTIGGQERLGEPAEVRIEIGEYADAWIPLSGTTHRILFDSDDARRQADGLHFNRGTDSSLTTARVGSGDVIHLSVTGRPVPSSADLLGTDPAGPSQLAIPQASGVPDILGGFAGDAITGEGTAYEQMVALEAALREGFFSDGEDGLSRSGHTNERLTSMFSAEMLIGDDEQYASAHSLIANQLGIPTRVVLGFIPPEGLPAGTPWEVRGQDARVWVESHFDRVGWVRFEPTPDRDRTPQTQVPKPRPQPRPMVEPPPNPPEQPAVEPNLATDGVEEEDGKDEESSQLGRYLLIAAVALGALAGLLAPFVAILVAKSRRRAARRSDDHLRSRYAGGWDEVLDRARDLGYAQHDNLTRREAAGELGSVFSTAQLSDLADTLDVGTFAPNEPGAAAADAAWARVDDVVSAMAGSVPWPRRIRARFSLKSIRHRRRLDRQTLQRDRAVAATMEPTTRAARRKSGRKKVHSP